jgi:hypothetical protein
MHIEQGFRAHNWTFFEPSPFQNSFGDPAAQWTVLVSHELSERVGLSKFASISYSSDSGLPVAIVTLT